MLENVSESEKLKVCTAIYDAMDDEEASQWAGGEQDFLEYCMAGPMRIVFDEEDKESRTLKLAESITRMADSLDELLKTGINRKLLILFIHDNLGRDLGKGKIEMVLDAIEEFIKETREG